MKAVLCAIEIVVIGVQNLDSDAVKTTLYVRSAEDSIPSGFLRASSHQQSLGARSYARRMTIVPAVGEGLGPLPEKVQTRSGQKTASTQPREPGAH